MTTLEDIYSSLAAHMIAGLMVHDQMASAYYFLNLKGYGKCQVYHYWCENKNYQCLKKHYMKYHCKLIRDQQIADPKIIPSNWLNYTKDQVDSNTKRNAVKTMMSRWIDWEEETKRLYAGAYVDFYNLGEVEDALYIGELLEDVEHELARVKEYYIKLQDCDFNLSFIIGEQECKEEKYKEKLKGKM